jgi:hypothetical protein
MKWGEEIQKRVTKSLHVLQSNLHELSRECGCQSLYRLQKYFEAAREGRDAARGAMQNFEGGGLILAE